MTKLNVSFQVDGLIDGDNLAAPTTTKRGGVKATGAPSGKFYKDDDTWADPAGTSSDITTTLVHAATPKDPIVDADELSLLDSAATFGLKKITWAVVKSTLKTYFDAIYAAATHNQAASTITSGTLDVARIPSLPATIITSGTLDGNRLPVMSSAKLGGVPATGTPSGKVLSDYGSWIANAIAAQYVPLQITFGDGVNVITAGMVADVLIEFPCTIIAWHVMGHGGNSTTSIDLYKCTYTNFDDGSTHPIASDTITASAKINVTSAKKATSSTLTGWSTSLIANDVLRFQVLSNSTFTKLTVALRVLKV